MFRKNFISVGSNASAQALLSSPVEEVECYCDYFDSEREQKFKVVLNGTFQAVKLFVNCTTFKWSVK